MHYSLLSRFRGAMLGAALGEIVGLNSQIRRKQGSWDLRSPLNLLNFDGLDQSLMPHSWGQSAIALAHHLLQNRPSSFIEMLPPADRQGLTHSVAGVAIAALPLTLYFHEAWSNLPFYLREMTRGWQVSPEVADAVHVFSYVLTLALQDRLHPPGLIPQLLVELNLSHDSPALAAALNETQQAIEQGASLAVAERQLQTLNSKGTQAAVMNPLAIALYCFLTVPDHFQLGLLRAAQSHYPRSACALLSALSGAHNGMVGLPASWRRPLDAPLQQFWGISEADLIRVSDQILAAWMGVYDPQQSHAVQSNSAIAAPGVLRTR